MQDYWIGGVGMSEQSRFHEFLIITASLALFFHVPPIVYGYLTYRQFEFFSVTGYMPYEEAMIALRSGSLSTILGAPLISLNMTSGHLFSNVYIFSIGALAASLVLGTLTGLAIVTRLRVQSAGGAAKGVRALGITALGLVATIGASSAGLLGCHGGSGMSGGILAMTGMSETTASLLARLSPYVQVALIVALAGYCLYLHRKLRQASARVEQASLA
jgi:hypothetical protein